MASAQEITPFSGLAKLRLNSKEAIKGKKKTKLYKQKGGMKQ